MMSLGVREAMNRTAAGRNRPGGDSGTEPNQASVGGAQSPANTLKPPPPKRETYKRGSNFNRMATRAEAQASRGNKALNLKVKQPTPPNLNSPVHEVTKDYDQDQFGLNIFYLHTHSGSECRRSLSAQKRRQLKLIRQFKVLKRDYLRSTRPSLPDWNQEQ